MKTCDECIKGYKNNNTKDKCADLSCDDFSSFVPVLEIKQIGECKKMKKIINGKKYDTETATKVGSWNNRIYGNDFRSCSEDLYKKKTGEYFIHGQGGAMSKYSKSYGNSTGGGEEITPLTEAEAMKWAEENLSGEEFEEIFGEVEE